MESKVQASDQVVGAFFQTTYAHTHTHRRVTRRSDMGKSKKKVALWKNEQEECKN